MVIRPPLEVGDISPARISTVDPFSTGQWQFSNSFHMITYSHHLQNLDSRDSKTLPSSSCRGHLPCLRRSISPYSSATVSFWDPGELSAAAYMLQVPHPPGGPLFSLTGKLFFLLPFPGNIGFRMNMVSVLASAVSVLFLYLVAVRVIRLYQGAGKGEHKYTTCISAAIGALALSFLRHILVQRSRIQLLCRKYAPVLRHDVACPPLVRTLRRTGQR